MLLYYFAGSNIDSNLSFSSNSVTNIISKSGSSYGTVVVINISSSLSFTYAFTYGSNFFSGVILVDGPYVGLSVS